MSAANNLLYKGQIRPQRDAIVAYWHGALVLVERRNGGQRNVIGQFHDAARAIQFAVEETARLNAEADTEPRGVRF